MGMGVLRSIMVVLVSSAWAMQLSAQLSPWAPASALSKMRAFNSALAEALPL